MPVPMLPPKEYIDRKRIWQLNRQIRAEDIQRKLRPGRQPKPIIHGTRAAYNKRGAECRCGKCREANAEYLRVRRSTLTFIPPTVHGTENGYVQYNCRCEKCKAASAAARRVRYNHNRKGEM